MVTLVATHLDDHTEIALTDAEIAARFVAAAERRPRTGDEWIVIPSGQWSDLEWEALARRMGA